MNDVYNAGTPNQQNPTLSPYPVQDCRENPVPGSHPSFNERSVQYVKGVGPSRARLLKKLGIHSIEDAFWFLPWRYEDRTVITPVRDLKLGSKANVCGLVHSSVMYQTPRKRLMVLTISIDDGSGTLECVFFNQPYLKKTLVNGVRVLVSGVVATGNRLGSNFQMNAPQFETLRDQDELDIEVGAIIPVYHETRGLTSRQIRRILKGVHLTYHGALVDTFPQSLLDRFGFPSIQLAMSRLHFPEKDDQVDILNQWMTPAHHRLAFEELFLLQLALAVRRRLTKTDPNGIAFTLGNSLVEKLHKCLPFQLTGSQQRVIQEIESDMGQPQCMSRLIQGDVGSGKTVVALHAMTLACGAGYQSALMAPTEVLCEQHYLTLQPFFRQIGINAVLLKGGQPERHRAEILEQLSSGNAQVVIGTHAILQPKVHFANLGLVIVDEQHKFGVLQRSRLKNKGMYHPDVLVMTATPIPRTLAMTAYGDLDVSVIDQLPPGRQPIQTLVFSSSEKKRAFDYLKKVVETGRQAYVVYPLVERSEKVDLQAAIEAAQQLQQEEFTVQKVGLLHGRMKSHEKQSIMTQFKEGEIQILVATTVIEVGIDVPNATVMLVEHADRFGLAQLHQLRGRVGRGSHQAYCLLINSIGKSLSQTPTYFPSEAQLPLDVEECEPSFSGHRRLEVLEKCSDGFALAEEDLKIRGPGDVLGIKQWGEIDFRVANIIRDHDLLQKARDAAVQILSGDPDLMLLEHQGIKAAMFRRWGAKFELGSVG